MGMDLKQKQNWSDLTEELLAEHPRLMVVQKRMRELGLKPGADLLACMERALEHLEPPVKVKKDKDREV